MWNPFRRRPPPPTPQMRDAALQHFAQAEQCLREGQVERAFALFREGRFPELPREPALAQAHHAYLHNRYDDGLLFLRPFLDGYKQLRILDDHFLYVRGLPFFGRWWGYLASLSILRGDTQELEQVTHDVAAKCHDYDFELDFHLLRYQERLKPRLKGNPS